MNGCRSPSIVISPRLVRAKRSCQPGGGTACQNCAHESVEPRTAKRSEHISCGPCERSSRMPRSTLMKNIFLMPIRQVVHNSTPRRRRSSSLATNAGSAVKRRAKFSRFSADSSSADSPCGRHCAAPRHFGLPIFFFISQFCERAWICTPIASTSTSGMPCRRRSGDMHIPPSEY